jgi:GDPmannose 4,6-dehydratase
VQEVFAACGLKWKEHVDYDNALMRPLDLKVSRGDPRRAEKELGWKAQCVMPELARRLAEAERATGLGG